jgi:hypothetical protein
MLLTFGFAASYTLLTLDIDDVRFEPPGDAILFHDHDHAAVSAKPRESTVLPSGAILIVRLEY